MSTVQEITPEQIVAVALAHDHIITRMKANGVPPTLSEVLDQVRQDYKEDAQNVCEAIGASLKTEKAIKGAVGLLALLANRRGR